jgi:hypothetical protein
MKITQQIKVVEEARHGLEQARNLLFDAGTNLEAVSPEFKSWNRFYITRVDIDRSIQQLKDYEMLIRTEDLNKEQA